MLRHVSLLLAGAFSAVLAMLLLLVVGLGPARHGLVPEAFDDTGRDSTLPAEVVATVDPDAFRPNIIVILADDLGYGDIGAYGGGAIETPNLDRIASEGLMFSHAYASAAICSPSRAGLLTGRYPLRSGIMTAMQMAGDSLLRKAAYRGGLLFSHFAAVDVLGGGNAVSGLPPSEITVPEMLRVAGYRSKAIGKWHLGDFTAAREFHPFNHGFDEFVGFNGSNDDFPVAFWRGEEEILSDIGAEQAGYTHLFTEEAVAFIDQEEEGPFFLYLAHKDPHLPFFPSEAFAGKSEGGPYGDAVSEFDASVGEVLAALERNGIAERTLVLVTSDNGPWFDGNPGELRGRKGQSYEGGFRVPLLAWWPGHLRAKGITATPVMNIDFLPTFAALAGLRPASDRVIDGRDLSAVLGFSAQVNDASEQLADRALYFFHDYDLEGIRRGPWKYYDAISHYTWPIPLDKAESLVARVAGARDYVPEDTETPIPTLGTWPNLYNLDRDPNESYDVLKKYPSQADALKKTMTAWRDEFYRNPRGWK